jgi:translation initiation factor IF-2
MNLAELARKLGLPLAELRVMLPKLGFDIGARAIKIDDGVAYQIIQKWPSLRKEYEKIKKAEVSKTVEEKEKKEELKDLKEIKEIEIPDYIAVRDFAALLTIPVTDLIKELMKNGILASQNEKIDYTTASIIAEDLGFKASPLKKEEKEIEEIVTAQEKLKKILEEKENLKPRPPVIVVMGHVDHGKTKILDYIRKTNVVATEAGGITQHIGAYQAVKNKRLMTFIDTPGHEAFTVMRSRGARVADIAILVVAADDGVQPQTVEALKIISAAKLPFVVAINKIDKPDINIERIKTSLSELGYIPEDYGGKIPCVEVSAKTGQGMDALLDMLLLIADLEKEKIVANPERNAIGTVIESHIDKGEGPVATVLIKAGTLKKNDPLVINGQLYGRVRAMKDWCGIEVKEAPPSMPVKILGFKVLPDVGEIVEVVWGVKALKFKKVKPSRPAIFQMPTIQLQQESETKKKFHNLILKTDVLGSMEAIVGSLEKINHPEVGVKIVSRGLGNITEGDVLLAEANKCFIYGFNVTAPRHIIELAREKNIEIRLFNIIYDLLDDVKMELEKMLSPDYYRTVIGKLKVVSKFWSKRNEMIVGALVIDGHIEPRTLFRILRAKEEVGGGTVENVQVGKQPVSEVRAGSECGVKLKTKDEIKENDVLEIYKEEEKKKRLVL